MRREMNITAERLQRLIADDIDSVAQTLNKVLVDFGYSTTQTYVKEVIQKIQAGEKPLGGPASFIANWIQKGIED